MHTVLGFAKIIYSRYQTKITFKDFDFFSMFNYCEKIRKDS